jgi:peptidoglycan hydrolase-like protein with peptidoglycan-binding domain
MSVTLRESTPRTLPKPLETSQATAEQLTALGAPVATEELAELKAEPAAVMITKPATVAAKTSVGVDQGTLGLGARGPAVSDLQKELASRGAKLNPTGTFDGATEMELKKMQKHLGLPMTGVVDEATTKAFSIPPGQGLSEARAAAGPRAAQLAVSAEEEAQRRMLDAKNEGKKPPDGNCASGVFQALEKAGFEPERLGHAFKYGDKLAARPDMTEIHGLSEKDLEQLPPGAIIVYGKSAQRESGHIAVVTDETYQGSVMEASDHLQRIYLAGSSKSYGTDFGHGVTGGPRFRVFMPTEPQGPTASVQP